MCFTLGINDYSDYTKISKERGEYVHEFTIDDTKYVSVLNKQYEQSLIDTCFKAYQLAYGKHPKEIYIKVSSKEEVPSKLFNYSPEEGDIVRYKKIVNPVYMNTIQIEFNQKVASNIDTGNTYSIMNTCIEEQEEDE